ncbi:tryptophan synthase subunit alpha [Methanobrevibacter arboriphilus]|uniref:tryptophan synthase subunit alpha n=1 Tax=Methanobrevibacter arboriphilus TaxID=39441 RepID=UPI002982614C|nr:tryptophan synthase subunit alpha [Methanobrevibacter arboriphilus]
MIFLLFFLHILILFFYYGYEKFFKKCKDVGLNGIVIPDLPYEEKEEISKVAKSYDVDIISLIAPTSKDRIRMIAKDATGFIYLVSSMGVTGVRSEIKTDLEEIIVEIRNVTDVPVAVGFGINTPKQAENISKIADGVIVGSAIIKIIEEYGNDSKDHLKDYVSRMKNATRF